MESSQRNTIIGQPGACGKASPDGVSSYSQERKGRVSPLGDDSTCFKLGKSLWFLFLRLEGKANTQYSFPKYGTCFASVSFSNMSYPGRRQQGSGQETAASQNETRLSQSRHWLLGAIKYARPETVSHFSSWRPE